jgi:hypothetical protein
MRLKKFQYILWPKWKGISFTVSRGSLSFIYDWFLYLGYFEIRKWRKTITQQEIDDYWQQKEGGAGL